VLAPTRPAKAHYHVAKLVRLMRPDMQHYRDERDKLIKAFGAESETATGERVWSVLPEHQETFAKQLQDLGAIPVEIPWAPLSLDDLPDLTGAELEALLPLIADPEATDTTEQE
jgi:hypothetical protein